MDINKDSRELQKAVEEFAVKFFTLFAPREGAGMSETRFVTITIGAESKGPRVVYRMSSGYTCGVLHEAISHMLANAIHEHVRRADWDAGNRPVTMLPPPPKSDSDNEPVDATAKATDVVNTDDNDIPF